MNQFVKELDYDTWKLLTAVKEIFSWKIEDSNNLNQDVLRQIKEIKIHLEHLIRIDDINIKEIFYELETQEIQKLYDRLQNIPIDFFIDEIMYNKWLLYLKNSNQPVYINNVFKKHKAICWKFNELELDDLRLLDDFFWEEPFQNISIELIKDWEYKKDIVH